MPEITFQGMTGLPTIALLSDDYFAQNGPPDLPSIPDLPDSEFGRAQQQVKDAIERVIGNVDDLKLAPTPLDINGAEIGRRVALAVQRYNRGVTKYDLTFMDICLMIFDGREDFEPGFMDTYNAVVESYAEALFLTVPILFENNPAGQNATLNRLFQMHQAHVNGLLRGTQAALRMAYGIAMTHSDLDVGPVQTISRPGKVPADFSGQF